MRWTPPLLNEPHVLRKGTPLIQEQYFFDEHARWKMLVTCLSLNLTRGSQVRSVLPVLFSLYDTPDKLANACETDLMPILQPLGMVNKRVYSFRRFSDEFLTKSFKRVKQLYGCGQYAQDSDDIFWAGLWQEFTKGRELRDSELKRYVSFLESYYNSVAAGT
jgi:hypothetical protein